MLRVPGSISGSWFQQGNKETSKVRKEARQIQLVMRSNHLILCHPLLLLPSIFPSIRVFSNESPLLIRWPRYWSFSYNISPSNGYSGLISFRMDWLDFFAIRGTLKSLFQHHSSKVSILRCYRLVQTQPSANCQN